MKHPCALRARKGARFSTTWRGHWKKRRTCWTGLKKRDEEKTGVTAPDSERFHTAVPRRAAPRFPAPFALCAAVCAFKGWGGVCTRQSPLKRVLRRLWAMCEKSRVDTASTMEKPSHWGWVFILPTIPISGGFCPLFTRSIKAQDKERSPSAARQPQSPAVRGFFRGLDKVHLLQHI